MKRLFLLLLAISAIGLGLSAPTLAQSNPRSGSAAARATPSPRPTPRPTPRPAARATPTPVATATRPPYVPPPTFLDALQRASTAPDFVGLAVAVVRNGHIETIRTYGVRSAGGRDPVTPDTVFRIASLSKAFAATAAAMNVREGRIKWTDKVSDVVPEFRLRNNLQGNVTIEDILSHRTGLPPYAYDNLLEANVLPLDILGRYGQVRPTCAPHDCFGYQNTAFNMIAPILERAEGAPYASIVRRRIFEPLGMRTASIGMRSLTTSTNWAPPHRRTGGTWSPVAVKEAYYRVPAAGGVNASVTDLALWLAAQMGSNPQALPPEIVAELSTARVSTPQETRRLRYLRTPVQSTSYGLGWRITNYAGHRLVNHNGSVEGYIAQIAYLPERNAGIVVLSNTRGARATKILPTWLDYELNITPRSDFLGLDDLAALAAEAAPDDGQAG